MRTTYTKTQLKHVVSQDSLRPSMRGVFYEPSKGTITCTNGHVMFQALVEVEEEDREFDSILLSLDAFENRGFWTRGNRIQINIKELPSGLGWLNKGEKVSITTAMEETKTRGAKILPVIEEDFPLYAKILSNALESAGARPVEKINFSLAYLLTLDKVVPNSFYDDSLELRFNGEKGAAVINSSSYDWAFIIMPRAFAPDQEWGFRALKNTLLENVTLS